MPDVSYRTSDAAPKEGRNQTRQSIRSVEGTKRILSFADGLESNSIQVCRHRVKEEAYRRNPGRCKDRRKKWISLAAPTRKLTNIRRVSGKREEERLTHFLACCLCLHHAPAEEETPGVRRVVVGSRGITRHFNPLQTDFTRLPSNPASPLKTRINTPKIHGKKVKSSIARRPGQNICDVRSEIRSVERNTPTTILSAAVQVELDGRVCERTRTDRERERERRVVDRHAAREHNLGGKCTVGVGGAGQNERIGDTWTISR